MFQYLLLLLLLAVPLCSSAQQWIGAVSNTRAGVAPLLHKGETLDSLTRQSIWLRRAVAADRAVRQATLRVCGLGFYEAYIDGHRVGSDILQPSLSRYDRTVYYNTYDVTPLLTRGRHELRVLLGNGFYNEQGGRYAKLRVSYGPPTLWLRLHLIYIDGTEADIDSNGQWQCAPSQITFNSVYGGEDYDATRTLTWSPCTVQQPPAGQLTPQLALPVRVYERLDAKPMTVQADASKTPQAQASATRVYDAGRNLAGFPEIVVRGRRGQTATITVGETLKDGAVNQKQTGRPHIYRYTLAGTGRETWAPRFTYYGFRYIQVDTEADVLAVRACAISNSAATTGAFECSSKLWNDTYRIIDRAVRSNWQSIWTDCPHREKLGWLEQNWLNATGLMANYDCHAMLRQQMRNIADAQRADGSVPSIVPEYVDFRTQGAWGEPFANSPEWGGAVVALPMAYYERYGDDSLVRQYYDAMRRYVDYLATQDSAYVLRQGLGDWYDYRPGERAGMAKNTPVPLVATAHYYRWTALLAQAASLTGHDPKPYQQRADSIAQVFNANFYDAQRHDYGSQTANAIALDMRLAPEADRRLVFQTLMADLRKHGERFNTGDIGTAYLFRVLADHDCHDMLFRLLNHYDKPGYGYQIAQGMTTLTEQWDPKQGASLNHFMLAHINNHLVPDIVGIRCAKGRITVAPHPVGDITWARGKSEGVAAQWRITGSQFTLAVSTQKAVDIVMPNGERHTTARDTTLTCDTRYARPLADVFRDVERRFQVRLKYNVDIDGLTLPYADWRVRPYSVEQTLDNICKYFDFNWWEQANRTYKIKPYEAPRRHVAEGRQMLDYLSSLYADRAQWQSRRDSLRREVRQRLAIDTLLATISARPTAQGPVRRHDGYTTQNLRFTRGDGTHAFVTVYAPAAKGRHALIICPDGHFGGGRYRADEQQRLATLARMGAVCADFDLYGWGQSQDEVGAAAHQSAHAHQVQIVDAITVLNYLLASRRDIDSDRIGVNGGSGGGTHTVLLATIDDRITASAPVVHIASHFDGGCPCESGMPVQLAAGGTCEAELAATFAPKPQLVVSDGGDWTASTPELELPYMKRVYGFYDAQERLTNVHLPTERHDFGPNKRNAVYDFFIKEFRLDRTKLDETKVDILTPDEFKIK